MEGFRTSIRTMDIKALGAELAKIVGTGVKAELGLRQGGQVSCFSDPRQSSKEDV